MAGGAILASALGRSPFNGAVIGVFIAVIPLIVLGITYGVMMAWRADRPVCRCGQCRSINYEFVGPDNVVFEPGMAFDYRCPTCKRHFRARDSRFVEVLSDGTEVPYMAVSKFGRWIPDQPEQYVAPNA